MKFITYLCGGINGLADSECINWREEAKLFLETDTLDPMRRDYRGIEDEHVADIVNGDLEDIAKADILLVNAERPSWGTAMEMVYARQLRKVIVSCVGSGKISPWLKFHSDACCPSLTSGIVMINNWARYALPPRT